MLILVCLQLTREWAKWLTGNGNHILPNLLSATWNQMKGCVDFFFRWLPLLRRSDSATIRDAVKVDVETLRNEIRELVMLLYFHDK